MLANRVKETTTTTGTGNLTLAGAATNHQTFNTAFGLGKRFYYWVVDSTNDVWECGVGEMSTSTVLIRSKVLDNSSGTKVALVLSAGTKDVFCAPMEASLFLSPDAVNDNATDQYVYHLGDSETTTHTVGASVVEYIPFFLTIGGEYSGAAISITGAVALSTARLGIYSISSGRPDVKIAETGSIDTSTSGTKEGTFASNVDLNPGWYYVAFISDSAVTVAARTTDSHNPGPLGFSGGSNLNSSASHLTESGSGIVLPATPSATPTLVTNTRATIALVKV